MSYMDDYNILCNIFSDNSNKNGINFNLHIKDKEFKKIFEELVVCFRFIRIKLEQDGYSDEFIKHYLHNYFTPFLSK